MKRDIDISILKPSLSFSSVTQSLLRKALTMDVPGLDFTQILLIFWVVSMHLRNIKKAQKDLQQLQS